MFTNNKAKQPKVATPVGKAAPLYDNHTGPSAAPSRNEISLRAYELYERRGRKHGKDQQDWINAERELLSAQQAKNSRAAQRREETS